MKKHVTYEKPENCGQELRGKSPRAAADRGKRPIAPYGGGASRGKSHMSGFAAAGYEGDGVRRGYRREVVTAYGTRDRAVEKPVVVRKAASAKKAMSTKKAATVSEAARRRREMAVLINKNESRKAGKRARRQAEKKAREQAGKGAGRRGYVTLERAQALVEGALVLPLLVLMLALTVQSCWTIYTASCVTPAISHAKYSIGVSDLATGVDANELLKARMLEAEPVLASGELTVTDAKIEVDSAAKPIVLNWTDTEKYHIVTKNELTDRAHITAHVEYKPVNIFDVFGNLVFVREVEASKVVDERFELR